ncbi:FAD-binding oxidoreductase [Nocardia yamanashiensis]|uniref:FAD-binding oxidoreductase n=1 Tax=Nocardia yamanashiensis TaxID=209247 RepID=UPI001E5023D8|nr:FAD-binding oxidoreductase [Nocardia yamanashiensis]UGT39549.1 FAD-binding oxidoreductase [Nocardia yamanashiensis]
MTGIGNELRSAVRGRVVAMGEDGFEQARMPWNVAVAQQPVAVVEVADADDAAAVVRCAGRAGLAVSTQTTGHGASTAADGTILVKTRALQGVQIDARERTARIGAGMPWLDVLGAAAERGLTGAVGSSDVVGVAGYTLGGGLGWFARSHGYAANTVRAFEVITADGVRTRVSADSEPDLFWALRGGGGDFALVTELELELFEAVSLSGGRMLWPSEQAEAVLAAFRRATVEAPEGLSIWYTVIQFPPFPQLPELLRGSAMVAIDVLAQGAVTSPLRWFEEVPGLVLDTRRPLLPTEIGSICMEPTAPTPARIRGELLTDLAPETAATLLDAVAPGGTPAPLALAQLRHLGGAIARPAPDAGCAAGIHEPYLLSLLGPIPTPELTAVVSARQDAVTAALRPHLSGRKPLTYLDSGESAAAAFDPETLTRLQQIKSKYDPAATFRSSYPVANAAAG